MPHAKFQSPNIHIDRYFQLFDPVTHSGSQAVSDIPKMYSCAPGLRPGAQQNISTIYSIFATFILVIFDKAKSNLNVSDMSFFIHGYIVNSKNTIWLSD